TEQEFLQSYRISDFERPSLAADIALFTLQRKQEDIRGIDISGIQILLIKRANHPYINHWALPGGFCIPSESIQKTARRELTEETGVSDTYLKLTGTYSAKDRDPRGWIISNTFTGMVHKEDCHLRADTDAWDAVWFTIEEIDGKRKELSEQEYEVTYHMVLVSEETEERLETEFKMHCVMHKTYMERTFFSIKSDLAFDHGVIIGETYLNLKHEIRADIRTIFNFFPEKFTLGEIKKAYEVMFDTTDTNFRRMVKPYVTETEETAAILAHRPAKYYVRNAKSFL
ncbi:MAG: NUDIX hydrolase, partial [Eubacteriales bacterium]|nr:NUDIX hydrolase [Eubacteriales bacterium]